MEWICAHDLWCASISVAENENKEKDFSGRGGGL